MLVILPSQLLSSENAVSEQHYTHAFSLPIQ